MEVLHHYYENLHAIFWSETFWFPFNSTWKDFEDAKDGPHKGIHHPQFSALYGIIPATVLLYVVRTVLDRIVLRPLARACGLKDVRVRAPEKVPVLNTFFRKNRRPNDKEIATLAQELTWSTRGVERWFRRKRNFRKSSVVKKFCEAGWRFVFYLTAFLMGVYVLHDEDFMWDWSMTRAMDTWPHHNVKTEFLYYYTIEIGFYLSLFASLLSDVRRSDFWVMTVHHLLTISLLIFSWTINCVRVGLVILILHDSSDYLLEATKLCLCLKKDKMAAVVIIIFAAVWVVTRVYLYPVHLVFPSWKAYFDWWYSYGHIPSICCQISLLLVIVALNMIWTYFIFASIYNMFSKGDYHDERSDSELSYVSSDECDKDVNQHNGRNGYAKNKHQ